ncbi:MULTISPECIES: sugar ABC transporter permease [unclassified Butyrivibrio]|uniref:ABC transporter permease n=1 Tax=unclassified Butyrivibrio TaxID=2639466 RepID=UPI0004292590|nr:MULTISPECIES: ABC transporter permease subunit [unclassified Butyrivibrio]SDB20004.1 putative aldouronate transport system permease protein [Butyrivibrio sp. INlla16]SEL59474.1 putative aldouronate transport system permease protein [Butyrivibrio sp. ob235]
MKKTKKTLKRFWPMYLMFIPGVVYLFINSYIPMFGIQIAFRQYNAAQGVYGSPWCGFKNFEFLTRTKDAWIMIRNTVLYNVVFIVLGTILAVATAIILNEIRNKTAKQAYQTIILIPFLISMVIVSYLAYAFLSTSDGFINNSLVKLLGKEPIDWYNTAKYWPVILVLINIWKGLGYNMILYYATICGIDGTLYEAAVVDGANRWQKIVHVTLPGLKSTIIILTLMALGGIFRSDFGLFYQVPLNSGPLINVTQTIDTYVYRGLIQNNNVGMSSAAGLYQSVVGFVLVVTANAIVRRIDNESSLF